MCTPTIDWRAAAERLVTQWLPHAQLAWKKPNTHLLFAER